MLCPMSAHMLDEWSNDSMTAGRSEQVRSERSEPFTCLELSRRLARSPNTSTGAWAPHQALPHAGFASAGVDKLGYSACETLFTLLRW